MSDCPALHALCVQLVLFQGSQVVLGQVTVSLVRAWMRRVKAKNERLLKAYAITATEHDVPSGEEHTLGHAESDFKQGRTNKGMPRANAFEQGLECAVEAGVKKLS